MSMMMYDSWNNHFEYIIKKLTFGSILFGVSDLRSVYTCWCHKIANTGVAYWTMVFKILLNKSKRVQIEAFRIVTSGISLDNLYRETGWKNSVDRRKKNIHPWWYVRWWMLLPRVFYFPFSKCTLRRPFYVSVTQLIQDTYKDVFLFKLYPTIYFFRCRMNSL